MDDEDHCSDADDDNKGDNRELGGDSAKETEDEDRGEKLNRVVKKKKKKKENKSVVMLLFSKPVGQGNYDDSWFSFVRCANSFRQLKVLEAVYIRLRNPDLGQQKEHFTSFTLVHNYLTLAHFINSFSHQNFSVLS